MRPKLREAHYRRDYRIWLRFADGLEGEVDLEAELWGEIFEPLKDKARFASLCWTRNWKRSCGPTGPIWRRSFFITNCVPTTRLNRCQEAARFSIGVGGEMASTAVDLRVMADPGDPPISGHAPEKPRERDERLTPPGGAPRA